MFVAATLVSLNEVLTVDIPLLTNVIKSVENITVIGSSFASHATIIAVKPILLAELVVMVRLIEPASISPTSPQIAPDKASVLIITFFTLIPTYLAVFSLSPTTDTS